MPEAPKHDPVEIPRPEPGLQKLDLKLFLEVPEDFDLDHLADPLLAIFGRWRLEEGEDIIDLADYAHVPDGPGCLLVSHHWHFGATWLGGRPNLFLSNRRQLSGSHADRIGQALGRLLEKSRRLLAEEEFPKEARAITGELEIILNDRLQFPNTEEVDADLAPAVREVVERLYGDASIDRESDPARRLAYRIQAASPIGLDRLIERLGGSGEPSRRSF